jgi:hypothetical protein
VIFYTSGDGLLQRHPALRLGDQEGFVEHARFVARTLKLHGVRKSSPSTPTTYALKELYPKYTGESFEVQPYFTCCAKAPGAATAGRRWPSTTPVFTADT